jgi:RHS repeat-associated protein
MTDANQAIVWDAVYTPFGQVHSITGSATNNQRFPGQYADAETGYSYNYFRDYDPTTGRYVQSDPIGLRGGLNTYRYVGGNPLYWIDPLGLAVEFYSAPADIAYGYVDHVWFKTSTKEAGVGGNAPNVGEEYESLYITDISIKDHTGQSETRKGATCKIVPNVEEKKVNELLEIGKPLGQFSAFNNCQTFANDVIEQSTKPTPPGRLDIPIK